MSKLNSLDEDFQKHLERMLYTDDDVLFNQTMTGSDYEKLLQQILN